MRAGRICVLFVAGILSIAAGSWSPDPWLADLKQLRLAIDVSYPNLEWLTSQREVSLESWFTRTADEIRRSHDDADARRAMDSLVGRFNDGHLALRWPAPASAIAGEKAPLAAIQPPATVASFCAASGYDAGQVSVGTAASLPGYRATAATGPFAAGLLTAGGRSIGVVRLGVFSPQGYPALCEQAVVKTETPINKPCDDNCEDRLQTEAYRLMTRDLVRTVEGLNKAGAQVLLVDITRNGGGSEWAEAAARIIAPVRLRSAPVFVVRGETWVTRWRALANKLRQAAITASAPDRTMLLEFVHRAVATAAQVQPCGAAPCSRLVQAGFASGILAELPPGGLEGETWAPDVFSPAQYPYEDSIWKGPVVVLVDSETWSAAEQFAALLQDNSAAIILGTRTGGAGCGHIDCNVPITLSNSGAQLEMPNCARLRKDGSNEVSGIVPDVPTAVRWNDGPAFAGRQTAVHLNEAVERAEALVTAGAQQRRVQMAAAIGLSAFGCAERKSDTAWWSGSESALAPLLASG